MKSPTALIPLASVGLGLLALATAPLSAQGTDAGSFLIRQGGRDIGTETFRVTPEGAGTRITSRTTYSASPPLLVLDINVVRQAGEGAFQLDRRRGAAGSQVYAAQRRNRVTIRRVDRGAEQASELPGSPGLILLADSTFGPLLQLIPLATAEPRTISALFPESGRRVSFMLERSPAPGSQGALIRLSGELEGEMWLGSRDEVLRISLPALRLEAHRSAK